MPVLSSLEQNVNDNLKRRRKRDDTSDKIYEKLVPAGWVRAQESSAEIQIFYQ
ncbi:MAG: hypothetical protein NTX09_00860 [Verrucomicrobia bacterium]|nr:hypothetical protein [Verrucomicrobiota bacterium]